MRDKVLELLDSGDDYISGQTICDKLNVSRTAVWKVIAKLKEEGYEIEAVRNKGYKIVAAPKALSANAIKTALNRVGITKYNVVYEDEIDSTNTRAKIMAEEGSPDRTLVVADMQKAGKGRKGRSFESLKGQGVFMTLMLRPDILPKNASMLTIIAATAVRMALHEVYGIDFGIKWPNDIIYDGRKVCGILTEMNTEMDSINYVVVGIGININNESFSEELSKVATSIKMITGKVQDNRDVLIAKVIKYFEKYYEVFLTKENLSIIRDDYDPYLVNAGKMVSVIGFKETFEAKAIGIDDYGELIIERDGVRDKVVSGEVSVRGIYGYV